MATKPKDGVPVKEKISSSPSTHQKTDNPHAKKSPKPSTGAASDKTHSEKPIPHYLSPTIKSSATTSHAVHKVAKKPASEDSTAKRLISRKSVDKPPSPSRKSVDKPLSPSRKSVDKPPSPSRVQKTPPPTNSKEKTLCSPSPSPKPTISSKPILEKTSKINKNAKHQPPQKMKYVKKGTIGDAVNKETKNANIPTTNTANSDTHEESEKCEDKDKNKDKGAKDEHEVVEEEDTVKIEGDQHCPIEIPLQEDQTLVDSINTEPEVINIEAPDTSSLKEEHEVISITMEEGDKKWGEDRDEEHEDERSNEVVVAKETREEEVDEETAGKDENADGEKHQGEGEVDGAKEEEEEAPKPAVAEKSSVGNPRDANRKKEAQVFNDVIEETASKLVEKKKNKVLALVGAFETVISLQEPEGQNS